jgi:hypothetical protein
MKTHNTHTHTNACTTNDRKLDVIARTNRKEDDGISCNKVNADKIVIAK